MKIKKKWATHIFFITTPGACPSDFILGVETDKGFAGNCRPTLAPLRKSATARYYCIFDGD
jgi:hypothetical protein